MSLILPRAAGEGDRAKRGGGGGSGVDLGYLRPTCQTCRHDVPDVVCGFVSILKDRGGRKAKDLDALSVQPGGSTGVPVRIVIKGVDLAVDLDRQLQGGAIEVEDERSNGVLTPEVRPAGNTLAKAKPHGGFGGCHRTTETSGALLGKDRRSHG